MKANKNVQDKIDNTFKVLDTIKPVNVSPFFKEKTMQRLFSEKEAVSTLWSWFTPQLQFATLACVVIVNLYAIQQVKSTNQEEAISSFASDYGLEPESESELSLF